MRGWRGARLSWPSGCWAGCAGSGWTALGGGGLEAGAGTGVGAGGKQPCPRVRVIYDGLPPSREALLRPPRAGAGEAQAGRGLAPPCRCWTSNGNMGFWWILRFPVFLATLVRTRGAAGRGRGARGGSQQSWRTGGEALSWGAGRAPTGARPSHGRARWGRRGCPELCRPHADQLLHLHPRPSHPRGQTASPPDALH